MMPSPLSIGLLLACSAFFLSGGKLAAEGLRLREGQRAAFKVLSIRDGLPNSSVSGLLQDSKGFIWMATQGGLARYDGTGFKTFTNEPFDESTISSDQLQTIFLDKNDDLWIGTYNGLDRLEMESEGITIYRADARNPESLSNDLVIAIARDARGSLWVGTLNGLNRLDEKTGKFKRYFHDPSDPFSVPNNTIRSLFLDREGRLWIGTTGGGFARYDYDADRFLNYARSAGTGVSIIPGDGSMQPISSIQAITQDGDGKLWLGAWGAGVLRFDPASLACEAFSLPDNRVYVVNAQDKGAICVGTWGGGLLVLDPEARIVERYTTSSALGSIPNDVIYSILRDASGELWVGTNGGGIAMMDRTRKSFSAFVADLNDPGSLPMGKILSTLVDSKGRLWASVYAKGIHRYDEKKGSWTHFRHSVGDASSLGDDICSIIYEDRSGTIWAATNDGLSRFVSDREGFVTLRHEDGDGSRSLGSSIVTAAIEDPEGGLWVGTYTTGLDHWDRKTGRWSHYSHGPEDSSSLSDNLVYSLAYDAEGRLWVGTNNGLNRLESSGPGGKDRFVRYMYDPNDRKGISFNSIQRMTLDSKGDLWIATRGGGAMRYDAAYGSFAHYTRKDGLPSNLVYVVLEDKGGNHWFVTQTGIARLDAKTKLVKKVALYKELENASFSTGSSIGPQGEIYFGSIGIIARFDPELYEPNVHVPPVFLTSLKTANEEKLLAPLAATERPVSLAYYENSVEFRFASLDYRDVGANQFAYKLEGFDKGWRYGSERGQATYTNLPGGRYVFRIRASNNDGLWNEEGASIGLNVAFSPFLGPPAIALYLLLIAMAAYFLATKRANRSLELKVRELSVAQVSLRAATEEARRLASEAERANEAKSEFISTVSHEVRTPMNGVIGMIDLLSRTRLDERQSEYVETIKASGQALLAVVNEVLDYSKLEAKKVELEAIAFDLRAAVKRSLAPFSYQAIKKGIELRLAVADDLPAVLLGDPLRFGQIVANLVSNAVKFTESGSVSVELGSRPAEGGGRLLVLEVRDTGIGIKEEKLRLLFEPFTQAAGSTARLYGGSGLGLSICKNLAQLMGGSLEAASVEGSGSSFIARLPLVEAEGDAVPAPGPEARPGLAGIAAPRKVLVVDDDGINRRVAARLLAELGIEVEEASSGLEALAKLRSERPDLVLMDCHMAGMDGLEATRRIRSGEAGVLDPRLLILAMTASADKSEIERALAAGMNGQVPKPVTLASLAAAIEALGEGMGGGRGFGEGEWAPRIGRGSEEESFDEKAFGERFAKDRGIGRQILEMFLAQSPAIVAAARAGLEAGDIAAVRDGVHRLKGTSGTVGGFAAARAAEAILELIAAAEKEEEAGKAPDPVALAASLEGPFAELERLLSSLMAAQKRYLESGALEGA